jgi:3'-phosphoadenosine 5'-phosphosulfate sulfotransferase (PAPS reductase)/FAD synthetase
MVKTINENGIYALSTTQQVLEMLSRDCVVAFGVSGGKDSMAMAISGKGYLDAIGHTGPRILIHANLGMVEWKDSLPACEKLATQLNMELVVVRRKAGGLMERWEGRWENNLTRYKALECVKLILPWSTPRMRFCTSELKTAVICSALSKRFKGQDILSATGIRRQESAKRSRMPISSPQGRLTRKDSVGLNWNPIIGWSTDDVFNYIREKNGPLHEAYTTYNSSRVSCSFCIMGSIGDLKASASCPDNHAAFHRMVELEIRSGFGLQGSRWLGDVAPHLLDAAARAALAETKVRAKRREEAEARIPKHLLFTEGWPAAVPSLAEAKLLAAVRAEVFKTINVSPTFITAASILGKYEALISERDCVL